MKDDHQRRIEEKVKAIRQKYKWDIPDNIFTEERWKRLDRLEKENRVRFSASRSERLWDEFVLSFFNPETGSTYQCAGRNTLEQLITEAEEHYREQSQKS